MRRPLFRRPALPILLRRNGRDGSPCSPPTCSQTVASRRGPSLPEALRKAGFAIPNSLALLTWDDTESSKGGRSVKVQVDQLGDARWIQVVQVQPNTLYRVESKSGPPSPHAVPGRWSWGTQTFTVPVQVAPWSSLVSKLRW